VPGEAGAYYRAHGGAPAEVISVAEFLTSSELKTLEKVIAKTRAEPRVHREPTPEGEAIAYRGVGEIRWCVNSESANLANGAVPLKGRKLPG
jgi:hypothetical protein